jgi:hypothetical protein
MGAHGRLHQPCNDAEQLLPEELPPFNAPCRSAYFIGFLDVNLPVRVKVCERRNHRSAAIRHILGVLRIL